jgi:hypothetical protein
VGLKRRDPYAFLAALERERVTDVLIDSLASVLPGADEITHGDRSHQLDAGRERARWSASTPPSGQAPAIHIFVDGHFTLSAPPSTTRDQRSCAAPHVCFSAGNAVAT